MHLFPLLTTSLTLFTPFTTARISGIALPHTITTSSPIPITILTQNYIQTIEDIAIAFGIATRPENQSMGTVFLGVLSARERYVSFPLGRGTWMIMRG